MSSIFRFSLAANLVLTGTVALLLWRDHLPAPAQSIPTKGPVMARLETSPPPSERIAEPPQKSAGQKLSPATMARLERAGIPRDILVNVLLEDLNRRSTQRVLALQKKYVPRLVPDREMRELSRQIEAEQTRELKETFGEDGYRAWDKEQTLHALNRARVPGDELPMSADEAEQAYRLQKEFDQNNREMQIAMEDGVADKADVGTLQAQAQATLDRELEKLLGPQRLGELRGNIDPTAEVYRAFGDLNPTPDQAKAVLAAEGDYRVREAALTKLVNENPAGTANVTAELKMMNHTREEDLRRIFGTEAYDNMKRQNDPTYKTLQQYAEAWNLTPTEIQPVYEALHALGDQTERMRNAAEMSEASGQRVNWRELDAAIELARRQTEAGLQNLIGDERLQRLKQNGVLNGR